MEENTVLSAKAHRPFTKPKVFGLLLWLLAWVASSGCSEPTVRQDNNTRDFDLAPNGNGNELSKAIEEQEDLPFGSMSGTWGELIWRLFALEPPDRLVDEVLNHSRWREDIVWEMRASVGKIEKVLLSLGVSSLQITEMKQTGRLGEDEKAADGEAVCIFRPSDEFINGLSEKQRYSLYRFIGARDGWNPYLKPRQLHPSSFRVSDRLVRTGLPESVIEKVDRLSYGYDGVPRVFSDMDYVLRDLSDAAMRVRLVKAVERRYSLHVQLRLSSSSDLASLSEYWGGRGRNREILPILESVADNADVDKLDIVHLLPPVPRRLLNSYPDEEMAYSGMMPNCFSTAASFFSDKLQQRFYDNVDAVLEERYERAFPPRQFGDLVVLWEPIKGELLHACNYIAGDIVFTKNGVERFSPWVFTSFSDLSKDFLYSGKLIISFFRLKPEFRQ